MFRKIRTLIIIIGVLVQIMSVVLCGFIKTQISTYTYMVVFMLCCLVIYRFIETPSAR